LRFFVDSLDEDSRTVESLLAKIELMFTDQPEATRLTLSTVHKAKGLEFETVFILDRDKYMPSRYAVQAWQKTQEQNLLYVAVTRAKLRLVYINSECWKS
jgi:superfamily I DNA/RNA helicase